LNSHRKAGKAVDVDEIPLEKFSAEDWAGLIASQFRALLESGHSVDLQLVSVSHPGSVVDPKYESFSLLFEGPAHQPLIQRTYTFEHPRLGRFDLFIVPVAKDRDRLQYEAVFSRLF
jgi:hypothetical protein